MHPYTAWTEGATRIARYRAEADTYRSVAAVPTASSARAVAARTVAARALRVVALALATLADRLATPMPAAPARPTRRRSPAANA